MCPVTEKQKELQTLFSWPLEPPKQYFKIIIAHYSTNTVYDIINGNQSEASCKTELTWAGVTTWQREVMTSFPSQNSCSGKQNLHEPVDEREPSTFAFEFNIMPLSSNFSTAFLLLSVCLIQLCLLHVSLGESEPKLAKGESNRRQHRCSNVLSLEVRNSISCSCHSIRRRFDLSDSRHFCNELMGLDTFKSHTL